MKRYFRSLWFRLIFGLFFGSFAAVLVASAFLYVRFKNVSDESRERTLQGQAKLIGHLFQAAGGRELVLPESMAPYYGDGTGKYAVLFQDETLLAASSGVTHAFHPIDPEVGREFFSYAQSDGQPPFHGISLKLQGSSPPIWVQVAFKDNEVIFDSVLEEFVIDIAWIWLPFVGILLFINMIVIKISLKPLVAASAQASRIGPKAASQRLTETGMPDEVLSLVKAINRALDRLEEGYKEQKAFIADAAHELRTPIAIMTTHMDILPNFEGKAALKEELGGLTRLVNQLLDNARIRGPDDQSRRSCRPQCPGHRRCGLYCALRHPSRQNDRSVPNQAASLGERLVRLPFSRRPQSRGKRYRAYAGRNRRSHHRRASGNAHRCPIAGRAFLLPSEMRSFSAFGRGGGTAAAGRGLAWRSSRVRLQPMAEGSKSATGRVEARRSR